MSQKNDSSDQQDKILLELDRETIRKLDFMIRFCSIRAIPLPNSNPDTRLQYNDDELKPAIMKIRREIHRKLFPEHED